MLQGLAAAILKEGIWGCLDAMNKVIAPEPT
jgi:hypothetical protein